MLTIKAEGSAGMNLRNDMVPQMIRLANVTGCMVEVSANSTLFWAYPGDTIEDLQEAYDRLYPASRYVAAHIVAVVPHPARAEPAPEPTLDQLYD